MEQGRKQSEALLEGQKIIGMKRKGIAPTAAIKLYKKQL